MIIIAGTFRVPPENLERFKPHMREMVEGSRAEHGCLTYSHGVDLLEPGLIRLFEIWRDQESIAAHGQAAHVAAYRAAAAEFVVSDRNIRRYEVASERPL